MLYNSAESFFTNAVVKQVNELLDRSLTDILAVIDQNINNEHSTFRGNLREFLELPGKGNLEEYRVSESSNLFQEIDLINSQVMDSVVSKSQEIQHLESIAKVMDFSVSGPP